MAEERLVTVATFNDSTEAHLARIELEQEGIPCAIFDEGATGWYPHLTTALGGIRLQVHESNAADAAEILDVPAPGEPVRPEAYEEDPVPTQCPECGSADVYRDRAPLLLNLFAFLSASASVPAKRSWVCRQCGHRWSGKDEGKSKNAEG